MVANGQVPSTQTNFPTLISVTDTRLKYISSGGHVVSANNGYDIRPYSDSALTTQLTYELVFYDGVNGILEMWVLVASLADASTVYLGYGDSTLTTDGSGDPWDTNYVGVWHFKDGTTLTLTDSSGGGLTLTNNGTATAASGKVDGAVALNGSTQYLDRTSVSLGANDVTLECWAYSTNFAASMILIEKETITSQWDMGFTGVSTFLRGASGTFIQTASNPSNSAWHHFVGTITGTSAALYVDGGSVTGTVAAFTDSSTTLTIGQYTTFGPGSQFNGSIDEIRISKTARSADYATVCYRNQGDNATFWPIGTEVAVGGGGAAGSYLNRMTLRGVQ